MYIVDKCILYFDILDLYITAICVVFLMKINDAQRKITVMADRSNV